MHSFTLSKIKVIRVDVCNTLTDVFVKKISFLRKKVKKCYPINLKTVVFFIKKFLGRKGCFCLKQQIYRQLALDRNICNIQGSALLPKTITQNKYWPSSVKKPFFVMYNLLMLNYTYFFLSKVKDFA